MVSTQPSSPIRSDSTRSRRVPTPRPSRWLTGSSFRLLLESVLIVLSVLLGFALSEWRARQADHERAAAALENFRREIRNNLATLEQRRPEHAALAERLAGAIDSDASEGETAFDVFATLMPEGGTNTLPLREVAWQTAASTGALRLLDYEVAALLSETYLLQASLVPTLARLSDRFSDQSNFDPQSRDAMIRVHHRLMDDLAGQEEYLIDTYRRALQRLPVATRP